MDTKFKLGQPVQVQEVMKTRTALGLVIGVKIEESLSQDKKSIVTKFVYLLSGDAHGQWFYEEFLTPLKIDEQKETPNAV